MIGQKLEVKYLMFSSLKRQKEREREKEKKTQFFPFSLIN